MCACVRVCGGEGGTAEVLGTNWTQVGVQCAAPCPRVTGSPFFCESHIEGETKAEGVREQGAEEYIGTCEERGNRGLEKTT